MFLWEEHEGSSRYLSSFPDFLHWKARNDVFEDMGAWMPARFDVLEGQYPDRVMGMRATASLFTTLGVEAQLGRTFLPEDERVGKDQVVLLSHRLWRNRFHGDPSVLGSTVTLSRNMAECQKYTVIGVLRPSFQAAFPGHSDIWAPLALDGEEARHAKNVRDRAIEAGHYSWSGGHSYAHARGRHRNGASRHEPRLDRQVDFFSHLPDRGQPADGAEPGRRRDLCPADRVRERGQPDAGGGYRP